MEKNSNIWSFYVNIANSQCSISEISNNLKEISILIGIEYCIYILKVNILAYQNTVISCQWKKSLKKKEVKERVKKSRDIVYRDEIQRRNVY